MNDDLELWTVRSFDDAAGRIGLPPRERWLPNSRMVAPEGFRPAVMFAGIAALALLALAVVFADPGRFGVAGPRPSILPTPALSLTPSPSESAAWGMIYKHAGGVVVLRPTWLPPDPGQVASSVAASSRGLVEYGLVYGRYQGFLDPRVRQIIFLAETLEPHESRLIPVEGVSALVTVRGHQAELVGNASGAWQLVWTEGGYRYAIQAAGITRDELLRIAGSLAPVVDENGTTLP